MFNFQSPATPAIVAPAVATSRAPLDLHAAFGYKDLNVHVHQYADEGRYWADVFIGNDDENLAANAMDEDFDKWMSLTNTRACLVFSEEFASWMRRLVDARLEVAIGVC